METPFEIGQKLNVKIDRLAYGGDGVARADGFTLFVPRTAPGDEVSVEITDVRKRYGRAVPLEWTARSPHRIEPKCGYFGECGGCHYQHLDPAFVAEQKISLIRESFERIGQTDVPIRPLISPQKMWNYRNRLTYHRAANGAAGYIGWRDYRVIDIDACPIGQDDLNRLWSEVKPALRAIPAETLPYVVLRRTTTGEKVVILSVTESAYSPELETALKEIFAPKHTSIHVHLTVIRPGARAPFGEKIWPLRGPAKVTEEIGGIRYKMRPDLFFQIHPEITARMTEDAASWAAAGETERMIDIYCGAGLFTLAAAKRGIRTLGVEVRYEAIQSAVQSAEENGLTGTAAFRAGKAERIAERLIQEGDRFDTAIVDPPRKGLHPDLIGLLPRLGVKRFLYISCSPPTLARDIKALKTLGYRAQWVQPYEMFPQTYHIETMTGFSL